MKLELISSDRCPFVQRSIVTLEQKSVPYTLTFVDPYDPPEWFSHISPLGKVPVLRVDDDTVLFESAVINEYLDEVTSGQLHPEDPLERALNKSWIEFGGSSLSNTFKLMVVPSEAEFNAVIDELDQAFDRLSEVYGEGPFFNGDKFSLVDAAYAPLFVRLHLLKDMIGIDLLASQPKMQLWHEALMAMPSVQTVMTPVLKTRFRELMEAKRSWANRLAA